MSEKVADVLWEMLANAGVKRCYGIVGDALNPVIDALRRNGKIEFIHVGMKNTEFSPLWPRLT
jgi:pyruvate dehydrogenase (quinone)